jgi:hypothetical protein
LKIVIIHQISEIRQAENVAEIKYIRNAYGILAGKQEGKTPVAIPRHDREDNIVL